MWLTMMLVRPKQGVQNEELPIMLVPPYRVEDSLNVRRITLYVVV